MISYYLHVLYLGYTAHKEIHPIRKINKIYFYLICVGLIGILFLLLVFKSFSSKDIWLLFFPISHNDFTFASSILLWYVFGNKIAGYIQQLSEKKIKSILMLIFWFFIIMPFLFGKPIWGINSGNNFVWVGVLFVVGALSQKINAFSRVNKKLMICFSLVIMIVFPIMLKISSITQTATNLQSRIYSNYSLPLFILSVLVFGIFIETRIKLNKKINHIPSINWFILTGYLITQVPIINYQLSTNFRLNYSLSGSRWLEYLIINILSVLLATLLTTLVISEIIRIPYFNRLLVSTSIKSINSLLDFPKFFRKILAQNWRSLLVIITGFIVSYVQMKVV